MKELTETQYHALCQKVKRDHPTLNESDRSRIVNLALQYFEKGQRAANRKCTPVEVIATHPYAVQDEI